jgi:hypothetical protein
MVSRGIAAQSAEPWRKPSLSQCRQQEQADPWVAELVARLLGAKGILSR